MARQPMLVFFFNDTATTEIYTLSLHDALPIFAVSHCQRRPHRQVQFVTHARRLVDQHQRSEEHTSELQSPCNIVCRLLLEKINIKRLLSVVSQRESVEND